MKKCYLLVAVFAIALIGLSVFYYQENRRITALEGKAGVVTTKQTILLDKSAKDFSNLPYNPSFNFTLLGSGSIFVQSIDMRTDISIASHSVEIYNGTSTFAAPKGDYLIRTLVFGDNPSIKVIFTPTPP